MVLVRVPEVMQDLCRGEQQVTVEAQTVEALIVRLDELFPGMRERLIDDSGLRRYINVYVNGSDVRYGHGLATPLALDDAVWILPTSSGGMAAR